MKWLIALLCVLFCLPATALAGHSRGGCAAPAPVARYSNGYSNGSGQVRIADLILLRSIMEQRQLRNENQEMLSVLLPLMISAFQNGQQPAAQPSVLVVPQSTGMASMIAPGQIAMNVKYLPQLAKYATLKEVRRTMPNGRISRHYAVVGLKPAIRMATIQMPRSRYPAKK